MPSLFQARFLQLVLGCAVNCDNKGVYIEAIMGMEESVQQVIMQAIQEIMAIQVNTHTREHDAFYAQRKEHAVRGNFREHLLRISCGCQRFCRTAAFTCTFSIRPG